MIILLHSSKTMRPANVNSLILAKPELINEAVILSNYLKTLSVKQLIKTMQLSKKLAVQTQDLIACWTASTNNQRVAIDSFLGDIYSGLQVPTWTVDERQYANQSLRILSGLYGILRPLDGIYPYRLEMGYKLPGKKFANLYNYWGESVAKTLPASGLIINLAALEYSKVITDYIDQTRVVTPTFLTINQRTSQPTFVVVHAKIARGAFAHWLIKHRIKTTMQLKEFNNLGYVYDRVLSSCEKPVFVCRKFGGLGLSLRLK